MPKYKYQGKFRCDNCNKTFVKKGSCRPKVCPACGADKSKLKLINKQEI